MCVCCLIIHLTYIKIWIYIHYIIPLLLLDYNMWLCLDNTLVQTVFGKYTGSNCAWTIHWFKLCLENTLVQNVHGQYTGSNCAWKIRWFKPCSIYLQSNSSGLVQRRTARIITKRTIVLKHTVNEKNEKHRVITSKEMWMTVLCINDCVVCIKIL